MDDNTWRDGANLKCVTFRSVSGRHVLVRRSTGSAARAPRVKVPLTERARTAASRFGCMGCAQALATAYADLVGLTEVEAGRLAYGFGLGMGRQLTCGAVTVMLMLAGMAGKGDRCAELFEEFEERMGSSACDYFMERYGGNGHCRELLLCAARLLNKKVF